MTLGTVNRCTQIWGHVHGLKVITRMPYSREGIISLLIAFKIVCILRFAIHIPDYTGGLRLYSSTDS